MDTQQIVLDLLGGHKLIQKGIKLEKEKSLKH